MRALTLAVALALALSPALLPAVARLAGENPWLSKPFLNFAHQGGETEAPSNTLFAFKRAIHEVGANVVELDVHATRDGELVVIHDTTVDRTTDGTGRIDTMTLDQVEALDAAHRFKPGCNPHPDNQYCATEPGEYVYRGIAIGAAAPPAGYTAADFRIPTLRAVLEAFPDTLINIEIKRTAPETVPYEKALADLLAEFGRTDADTMVVSFSDHATEIFRLHSAVSTAAGLGETAGWWATQAPGPSPGLPFHHDALQVPMEYQGIPVVTPRFIRQAHEKGLAVHVWTVDDEDTMRTLLCWGADGIMTSKPSLLAAVLADTDPWGCVIGPEHGVVGDLPLPRP